MWTPNNADNFLFAYGTLMDPEMRAMLLKEEINAEKAVLLNYALKENGDYYFISETMGASVEGVVIKVTEDQLLLADQWEEIPYYQRIKVPVNINDKTIESWAYVRNYADGKIIESNMASSLERSEVFRQIDLFHTQLDKNTLPYNDLYILIPCVTSIETEIFISSIDKSCFESNFIEMLNSTCQSEFKGLLSNRISRSFLPMIEIAAYSCDGSTLLGYEKAALILSVFEINNYASLNIVIPAVSVPTLNLLDQLSSNSIRVRDIGQNQFLLLEDYLLTKGIKVYGVPRVALFFKDKPSEKDLISTLLCETESPAEITSRKILNVIDENIAQYSSAEIYASETCVVEIPKKYNALYELRLNSQILTLFIVELIQLQEAALKKVSIDIFNIISQKTYKSDILALRQIETITEDYSKAMLLWDINNFKYRTAQILADEFSKKFEMNKKFDLFFQNKSIVEQLTQVHSNRINISESKLLNQVLLLLAFIQIVPVIYVTVQSVLNAEITLSDMISGLSSIVSCFMIWIAFKSINRKKIQFK